MKRSIIAALALCVLLVGTTLTVHAEEKEKTVTESVDTSVTKKDTTIVDSAKAVTPPVEKKKVVEEEVAKAAPKVSFHQEVKKRFIEGGVLFMSIVLACLILGLAVAIERIIALNLASTNIERLLADVKGQLTSGGVDKAREYCAKLPGPVASIFAQGLLRSKEGPEAVEKSIQQYGSVEMGKLEKGLSWVSLFISLAPMFGFMGTVLGMIVAFDKIAAADDISASIVAVGIKQALLTTVAGLVVAVILQILYNYLIHKLDAIVNQMEEASISLVDTLIAYDILKK